MEDSEIHNNANHHRNILALLRRSKRKEEERKRKEKKPNKWKEKRTDNKILICEKKNLVKKDQCNKSHSLIPLHSNRTCVLKATAAGFISPPIVSNSETAPDKSLRNLLWANMDWPATACISWCQDVSVFQIFTTYSGVIFIFFWATLISPANLSNSL